MDVLLKHINMTEQTANQISFGSINSGTRGRVNRIYLSIKEKALPSMSSRHSLEQKEISVLMFLHRRR